MHRSQQAGGPPARWLRRAAAAGVMAVAVLLAAGRSAQAAAGPAAGTPGALRWLPPLAGRLQVTRAFLPPATRYGRGHRGVDLAAPPGSAVRSAGAGVVTFAGSLAGRGVVVVRTGRRRTTYEPLAPAVHAGSVVGRGQLIGSLRPGHPGCPTAACLHWGLLVGEQYRDPLSLLRPVVVRLLPLDGAGPVGATVEGPVAVTVRPTGSGTDASTRHTSSGDTARAGPVTGIGIGVGVGVGAAAGTRVALRRRTPSRPTARAP